MSLISAILLIFILIPVTYLFLLAFASVHNASPNQIVNRGPCTRFVIGVPAHDEEAVIQTTVRLMRAMDNSNDSFEVHVVADHCSDNTAHVAREAGANVHIRDSGPGLGKGAALSWLFNRIINKDNFEAVVIFDADTRVDSNFLRVMDARLAAGDQIIQGQRVISNREAGCFPALT